MRNLLFFLLAVKGSSNEELDTAILESMIPPSSEKCIEHFQKHSQTSSYRHTFEFPGSLSEWSDEATVVESDLFLAEISHADYRDYRHTWTMRIGRGGNIYSFRGAYGEAIPPQHHVNAEFIDEVLQSVSVNQVKNDSGEPYFIHQAGVYKRDEEHLEQPFFSPSIAKHCINEYCSFASVR